MNKKQFIEFQNQQYIQNKKIEIAMEKTRLAVERRNEEIEQSAIDAYTLELINSGIL